ncbi:MAG: hypothetical protein ABR915_01990 [Thermoguttaceae bacterium]
MRPIHPTQADDQQVHQIVAIRQPAIATMRDHRGQAVESGVLDDRQFLGETVQLSIR